MRTGGGVFVEFKNKGGVERGLAGAGVFVNEALPGVSDDLPRPSLLHGVIGGGIWRGDLRHLGGWPLWAEGRWGPE